MALRQCPALHHVIKGLVPENGLLEESRLQKDSPGLIGKDDEDAGLLVEDALELLVQDHLGELAT